MSMYLNETIDHPELVEGGVIANSIDFKTNSWLTIPESCRLFYP